MIFNDIFIFVVFMIIWKYEVQYMIQSTKKSIIYIYLIPTEFNEQMFYFVFLIVPFAHKYCNSIQHCNPKTYIYFNKKLCNYIILGMAINQNNKTIKYK